MGSDLISRRFDLIRERGARSASSPCASARRKRRRPTLASEPSKPRHRPTLPQGCPCNTIGPEELNFRVRDGNGCDLSGIDARKKLKRCAKQGRLGGRRKSDCDSGESRCVELTCPDRTTRSLRRTTSVVMGSVTMTVCDDLILLPARLETPVGTGATPTVSP